MSESPSSEDKKLLKNDNPEEGSINRKIDNSIAPETPWKTRLVRFFQNWREQRDDDEDIEPVIETPKIGFFKLVSTYFIKKWPYGLAILILLLLASVASAFGPYIINNLTKVVIWKNSDTFKQIPYDQLSSDLKPIWDISWEAYMGLQIALLFIVATTTFAGTAIAGFLGKYIEVDLRDRSFARLITQDMSYYSDKKIGDILTKVVSDTQIIGDQSQAIPTAFLSAVFTTIAAIIMAFVMDWKLSLVIIVMFVLIIAIMLAIFGSLRKLMFKARDVITKVNGTVINRISTVQLIKTSGTEAYEKKGFVDQHKKYASAYKRMVNLQAILTAILIIGISSIQIVLIIAAAIIYKNDTTLLITKLPAFLLISAVMIGPLMQVIRVLSGIIIASTSAERTAQILYSKSNINTHLQDKEGIYLDSINGNILFKDVVFAYPEKPTKVILPKTDFTFEQGKKYAFVGETGAGKSTISKLLLRFYDPTYGDVLINNDINLKDIHLSSYLDHVGYVEQEPQILLGNIWENVRYGTADKTNEQVIEACKKADLDRIIQTWPDKYDTILGERGFMLSGGQKQRLVIARMFLKDPELLILDEATSALDNIVEKEIQGQLNKLMQNRTTVSIAHRLSTIKNADQIIVLVPGKGITQVGSFEELKKQPGHFKDLYEAGLMK